MREQEEDAAALIRRRGWAHRRRGSGAHPLAKGDAIGEFELVECKQTAKKSFTLHMEWFEKIEREAAELGRQPVVHIRFLNALLGTHMTRDWVLLPARMFEALLEGSDGTDE